MAIVRLSKSQSIVLFVTGLIASGLPIVPSFADQPAPKPQSALASQATASRGLLHSLVIDSTREDPAITFERWRQTNRLTISAPFSVQQGHEQFVTRQGLLNGAKLSSSLAPISPIVGNNVDLAGGVLIPQEEVAVAQNPLNSQQLVAAANSFYADPACHAPVGTSFGTQALFGSADGGQTWVYSCAPWPSNVMGTAGYNQSGSDPSVAWDINGNAYAGYLLIDGAGGDSLVIAKSSDQGQTWQPYGTVVNETQSSTNFEDKDMIAIDGTTGGAHSHTNRLYAIWDEIVLNAAGNAVISQLERVAYSDDGTSWHIVDIDTSTLYADIGGDLAIGSDGTVYAVWNRVSPLQGSETGESTMFSKSVDGGLTWTAPAGIVAHNLLSFGNSRFIDAQNSRGINTFPSIAVDTSSSNSAGTLYVAYADFPSGTNSGDNTDVYCMVSTNGGATWLTPVKVNDDNSMASQFFPWVAVDQSSGLVAMSWYDTRNDSTNRKTQIFLSTSTNEGSTWAANTLVTEPSSQFSNSTVNYSDENTLDVPKASVNQYGDYAQISIANGVAHPVWTDSRQFYPRSNTTDLREDVASASVTVAVTNSPPTASDGMVSTIKYQAVSGTLSASDVDGDALTYSIVTNPVHGTLSITNSSTGAFTYTPASNYAGRDSFTFKATDSSGNSSNVATETVLVSDLTLISIWIASGVL